MSDIYDATTKCIYSLEACLSVKALMKEGWAESRLADMKLWASGVGALARPDASLDRRLIFQPKLRLVLTSLLLSLHKIIESCRENALSENPNERPDDIPKPSPSNETFEPALGSDSGADKTSTSWFIALGKKLDADQDDSSDSDPESEPDEQHGEPMFQKVMRDIDDILDQLMILGLTIRKSGTVARLQKADASFNPKENEDLRKHLEFILLNKLTNRQKDKDDKTKVTTKERVPEVKMGFGDVTPEQEHLILGNLRRRHRFRYAKSHQQKLGQYMVQPPIPKFDPIVPAAEEHHGTTRKDKGLTKTSDDGDSPQQRPTPEITPFNTPLVVSQSVELSSTAPSAVEDGVLDISLPSQVAASRVSVSVTRMNYPSAPPISEQMKGFKCPCCYQTLPVMFKDTARWRKHLTEDLCPYTCPFPGCPKTEVLYISRETWRDHILQTHGMGSYWECSICLGIENITFSTAEEFASHNRKKHQDTISDDDIPYMQDSCRKIALPNILQCPLCSWPRDQEVGPDAATNLEHVGDCIHEFSLKSLPWAESLPLEGSLMTGPSRKYVDLWLADSTGEGMDVEDIRKVDITSFRFFPSLESYIEQPNVYNPEEYFAESSKASTQVERESMSSDSELPEVRGTYSDDELDSPILDSEKEMTGWDNDERLGWLNLPNYSLNLEQARDKRFARTGSWFMESAKYANWKKQRSSLLWLKGNPGCGKTILSSLVIDNILESGIQALFFFFDSSSSANETPVGQDKTSIDSMIRSLIHQIHSPRGGNDDKEVLFSLFQHKTRKPETREYMSHFERMAKKRRSLWMILDGIDECDAIGELLDWIEDLFRDTELDLHLLITSRHDDQIDIQIKACNITCQTVEMKIQRSRNLPLLPLTQF